MTVYDFFIKSKREDLARFFAIFGTSICFIATGKNVCFDLLTETDEFKKLYDAYNRILSIEIKIESEE